VPSTPGAYRLLCFSRQPASLPAFLRAASTFSSSPDTFGLVGRRQASSSSAPRCLRWRAALAWAYRADRPFLDFPGARMCRAGQQSLDQNSKTAGMEQLHGDMDDIAGAGLTLRNHIGGGVKRAARGRCLVFFGTLAHIAYHSPYTVRSPFLFITRVFAMRVGRRIDQHLLRLGVGKHLRIAYAAAAFTVARGGTYRALP